MTTFLLRAPSAFYSGATQAQALSVLAFLKKGLGVKAEFVFSRIVCPAPGVLLQVRLAVVCVCVCVWLLGVCVCACVRECVRVCVCVCVCVRARKAGSAVWQQLCRGRCLTA
jgi:hypothetical protein